MTTDDFDRAIADWTELVRLKPTAAQPTKELAETYVERAKTYRFQRDYDRAIADCTEAIRLDANNAKAFAVRGEVRWQKDEYDLATADASEAIRLDPTKAHKDLLEKVQRSIRNAAAKTTPAPRQEAKPVPTPAARTTPQQASKPTPVQPPKVAPQVTSPVGPPKAKQADQSINLEALMDRLEELFPLEIALSTIHDPSESVLRQREAYLTEVADILSQLTGKIDHILYGKYHDLLVARAKNYDAAVTVHQNQSHQQPKSKVWGVLGFLADLAVGSKPCIMCQRQIDVYAGRCPYCTEYQP